MNGWDVLFQRSHSTMLYRKRLNYSKAALPNVQLQINLVSSNNSLFLASTSSGPKLSRALRSIVFQNNARYSLVVQVISEIS